MKIKEVIRFPRGCEREGGGGLVGRERRRRKTRGVIDFGQERGREEELGRRRRGDGWMKEEVEEGSEKKPPRVSATLPASLLLG